MKEYEKIICHECGEEDTTCYGNPTGIEMLEQKLCFNCHFWLEKVEWQKAGDKTPAGNQVVRERGRHFVANPFIKGELPRFGVGFGGAKWHFRLLDGTDVVSNNVWAQGTIPAHFRKRLPDNAVEVKDE